MLRKLVIWFGLVFLGSTLVYAKQGTVVTKDGHTYEGDVTEQGDSVEISGVAGLAGPVRVNKANVDTLSYADKVADEVHAAMKKLDANDVKSRLELARVAMKAHAYEAARDVLVEAAKIEPGNREVSALMVQLAPLLPPPATAPATAPAVVPVAPVIPPPVAPIVRRQVTPAEINTIRQCEWRPDDDPSVKIQIKSETKKKFLETNPDVAPADFNQMSVNQQAALILSKGQPVLNAGVQLTTDPASIIEFKKTVNMIVVHNCATTCHNGPKGGNFTLATTQNNAGIYTNFLTLQQYSVGKSGPLVDRVNPNESIVLQYMLEPSLTKTPHPKAPNFRPALRSTNDTHYTQIFRWIQSLNPIVPHYGIDLTKDPVVIPTGKPEPVKKPG